MRKALPALFLIILILIAAIYLIIPDRIYISKTAIIPATPQGTFRVLSEKNNWNKWWPDTSRLPAPANDSLLYNGYSYLLSQKYFNALAITISDNRDVTINSTITVLSLYDSVALEWQGQIKSEKSPLKRLKQFRQASEIERDMQEILNHIRLYLTDTKNIYGMDIRRTMVRDTVVLSTKFVSHQFPTTSEIYSAIKKLQDHISRQGARETNFPMLNISMTDSNTYQTMVAIPVNQVIKEKDDIFLKRMVRGYILEAEVSGGPYTVRQAVMQLENFVKDYALDSPAIPFESLVTDRPNEPDTTKWITKLYYPVL